MRMLRRRVAGVDTNAAEVSRRWRAAGVEVGSRTPRADGGLVDLEHTGHGSLREVSYKVPYESDPDGPRRTQASVSPSLHAHAGGVK